MLPKKTKAVQSGLVRGSQIPPISFIQDVDKEVIDSIRSVQRDYLQQRASDHYSEVEYTTFNRNYYKILEFEWVSTPLV